MSINLSEGNATPAMTSHKATWTAIATALTSVVLALSGVTEVNVEGFSEQLTNALALGAAAAVQGVVAWATAYYKRNYLK